MDLAKLNTRNINIMLKRREKRSILKNAWTMWQLKTSQNGKGTQLQTFYFTVDENPQVKCKPTLGKVHSTQEDQQLTFYIFVTKDPCYKSWLVPLQSLYCKL